MRRIVCVAWQPSALRGRMEWCRRPVPLPPLLRGGGEGKQNRAVVTRGGAGGGLVLELGEDFEVAEGFGFDGFGFGLGVEDDFELALVSEEGAEGLGVVAGGAAFLDAGVAGEGG